ncbi:MAG: OmpH family outer membrane protein, partial [Saprospiraceae bacterium]
VAHLYYLNLRKAKPAEQAVIMPAATNVGVRVAHVNADTLDAKYEWLKKQKSAIEQKVTAAQNSLGNKKEALMKDLEAFQTKYQSGTMTEADAKGQYEKLMQRQQKLAEDEERLSKQLGEDQKKAFNDLYANVESQLKTLSSQIGYDYILSYSRGGPILLANDSLDITTEVLQLLNSQEAGK